MPTSDGSSLGREGPLEAPPHARDRTQKTARMDGWMDGEREEGRGMDGWMDGKREEGREGKREVMLII